MNRIKHALLIVLILFSLAMFATTSAGTAQASTSCMKISDFSGFSTSRTQTVYIHGTCFGTHGNYSGQNTPYFEISVNNVYTPLWNACYTPDTITCSISYWQNNQITFTGFSGQFGKGNFVLKSGYSVHLWIMDPQDFSNNQWSCWGTVNAGSSTCVAV